MLCTEPPSADLVFAVKVDDDIFQREASLLTQAGQHVFDELAVPGGRQGGTAIGEVDAAITPFHPEPAAGSSTLLWRTGTRFAVLRQK